MFKFIKKIRHERRLRNEKICIDEQNWYHLAKFLPLSEEAQVYLANSHWEEGVDTYQHYYNFCPQARTILLEKTSGYAAQNLITKGLTPEDETFLVEKGSLQNVYYYFSGGRKFSEENEIKLVKRAITNSSFENAVIEYAKKYNRMQSQEAEILLINQGRGSFILAYINIPCEFGLFAKAEVELIKRKYRRLIKAYEKKYNWQPDAQDLIDAGWLD